MTLKDPLNKLFARKAVIKIITGFPGAGKSSYMLNEIVPKYIAEGKRVLYLVPSHDRVDEFVENMVPTRITINGKIVWPRRTTTIWRGIKRVCPLYQNSFAESGSITDSNGKKQRKLILRTPGSSDPKYQFVIPDHEAYYNYYNNTLLDNTDPRVSKQVRKQVTTITVAIDSGLPASIVCPVCKKLGLLEQLGITCNYGKQFQTRKKLVITVHDYLATSYPHDFDVIIADDLQILKAVTFNFPEQNYYDVLEDLMIIVDLAKDSPDLTKALSREKLEELWESIVDAKRAGTIEESLKKLLNGFRAVFGDRWVQRSFSMWYRFITDLARAQLEFLNLGLAKRFFDVCRFLQWFYYYSIYNKNKQSYSRPYIFYLFDWAIEGKEVYLVSANFTSRDYIKLFEHLIEQYRFESGISYELDYTIKPIDLPDGPKGTVYFYKKIFEDSVTGRYPTKSLLTYKKTLNRILTKTRWLSRFYTIPPSGEGLGIVTGKDLVDYVKEVFPKTEVIHFFNLEGSNKLASVKLLVIIGTPEIGKDKLVKIGESLFPNYEFSNNEASYEGPWLGYRYRDPLLDNLNRAIVDMELFQAIHRARSIRKDIDVFVFAKPIALIQDIGLKVCWFDITKTGIYIEPIYNKIRFSYELTIDPHKKTIKTHNMEELKKFLKYIGKKLVIGQEFEITYQPQTDEVIIEEKGKYYGLK